MGDKCKWKNGQIGNKPAAWELWQCDKRPFPDSIPLTEWDFCPYCGADIRKPEPAELKEPKIKPSTICQILDILKENDLFMISNPDGTFSITEYKSK